MAFLLLAACSGGVGVATPEQATPEPGPALTELPAQTRPAAATASAGSPVTGTATGPAAIPATSPPTGLPSSTAPALPGAIAADQVTELIQLAQWGKGAARELTYSPDGRRFALFTALGVYIYDAETLAQQRFFPAESAAYAAAFSPVWETLAWGMGDTVRLRRVADGSELFGFVTEQGAVSGLHFSPDGSQLAVLVRPPGEELHTNLLELRQTADGRLLNSWDLQGLEAAFSPDWTLAASWSGQTGLRLWRLPEGSPLPFQGEIVMPYSAAFSPDGALLAVTGGTASGGVEAGVTMYRVPEGTTLYRVEIGALEAGFGFTPGGQTLVTVAGDGQVHFLSAADGEPLKTLQLGTGPTALAGISPDGAVLALDSSQGVAFWRVSDGSPLRTLEGHFGPVARLAVRPGGESFATLESGSLSEQGVLTLWRPSNLAPLLRIENVQALSLALSQDGARVALGGWDGTVEILDAADGRSLHQLERHPAQVQSVEFSPDGSLLASSSMEEVRLWSATDGAPLRTLPAAGGWLTALAFSPDGQLLAGLSGDGSLRLWNTADGSLALTLVTGEAGWSGAPAFSPDGKTLALAIHQTVYQWQLPGGEELDPIRVDAPAVTSLVFMPDGRLLALGLSSGPVEIWDPAGDEPLHRLVGHTDTITGLAFTADGRFLLSGSFDGTIRLWGLSGAR